MRVLLAIVVLAASAWGGWWWWGATTLEGAVNRWLAERRAAGWVAEAAHVGVQGFPNRLDLTVQELDLADPAAGWAWQAEAFQVLMLSYRPNHVIAVLPGTQVISTPLDTATVTSALTRGSVVFEPNTALALDRSSFEIADMAIAGTAGWEARVAKASLATRQAEGENAPPFAHDLALSAETLVLPERLTAGLGGGDLLPEAIERLSLDARLDFDRPWDRPAVEAGNPVLEGIRIRDAAFTWGELDLRGRGTLSVDAEGFAEGRIDLRARNWGEMIAMAERSGLLGSGLAGTLRSGLDLIAMLSGDRNSLQVPLDFEDGVMRLGPVVIGDAPRLVYRY
jgi:hypothetical protein